MTDERQPRLLLHPSPVGEVLIIGTDAGIVTLHPLHEPAEREIERLSHRLGAVPERAPDDPALGAAAAQLDEYFAGRRESFDLSLDWRLVRGFTRAALEAVRGIPYGQTAGYGEVAALAGSPRAARAVGTACATTPFSIVVPVHRVVRADGSLGEYGGHPEIKARLIDLERAAAPRAAAGE